MDKEVIIPVNSRVTIKFKEDLGPVIVPQWYLDETQLGVDDKPKGPPAEEEQQNEEQQLAGIQIGASEAAPSGPDPREEPEDHQDPEKQTD
jgi:hypothetical protein